MKKITTLFLAITLIFSSFLGVQAKVVSNKKTNISISKKTNFNTNTKKKNKVIQNKKNVSSTKNTKKIAKPSVSKPTVSSTIGNKKTTAKPSTSSVVIPVVLINSDSASTKTSEKVKPVTVNDNKPVNSDIVSAKPVAPIANDNIIDTTTQTNNGQAVQEPTTPTPVSVPSSSISGKFNISSKDIKFYNSNLKEFIALPITYTTYKNSTQFVPKYTINKSGTNIEVVIDDSKLSSAYTNSFSSMKRTISIQSIEGSKTKISITCSDNADVDVYRTSNKPKISGNSISNRDFLVFSFFDKTKDSSTINIPDNSGNTQTQDNAKKPKSKFLIAIDPGHGGKQPGTCGAGMKEKDLTLDISLKLRDLLLSEGYDIYMIRDDDTGVDLYDRATASNIMKSDLFLSIHINAIDNCPSYNGTTVLYNSKAKNPAPELAKFMRDSIADAIKTKKLPLQDRPKLVVLNSTNSPSILIEVAVLTNPSDAAKLKDANCKQTIANTIADSLNVYFGFKTDTSSKK